jgi:hypothetical protein
MTTQALPYSGIRGFLEAYITPLYAWLKELTRGEKLLLIAVLCFGAVGSYNTHAFYAPSRGEFVGWMAAIGNELLYLGAAGLAVKLAHQIWISRILMGIGALASAYFGVLVSLRESLPGLFGIHNGIPGGEIVWPTPDKWAVFGSQSIVEGVVPALAALLLAILLHSQTSHRLMEADDKQQQIQQRKEMKPFGCPFCTASHDSAPKLWGHFGRCPDALADPRSPEDKRAIVQAAVADGKRLILEG